MNHGLGTSRHPNSYRARGLSAALTGACLALLSLTVAAATPAPVSLALDAEANVNGIAVACTGIGGDTRADPRWSAYNVRIEFSNASNEYVTDGVVILRDASGRDLLSVSCGGPWVLLRLSGGRYSVKGWLSGAPDKPRSARFTPPIHGPVRVVLQFP